VQTKRIKYLFSPKRLFACRSLFRAPLRAFVDLCFLGKQPFELTLKSGRTATFSRAGRDHKFWDWYFAFLPKINFTEEGLIQFPWRGHKLLLRPGTQDFFIFQEIFIDDEYGLNNLSESLDTVIDLGANAGLFSCAILNKAKRVVSVEAVRENHQHTARNVLLNGGNPQDVLHLAVADRSGETLTLFHNPRNSGGHSVDRGWSGEQSAVGQQETTESISLKDLLDRVGSPSIDLLKCDIEGSEYNAFLAADRATLRRIQRIAMEVHTSDSYPPSRLQELVTHFETAGFYVRLTGQLPKSTAVHAQMLYAELPAIAMAKAA